MFFSVNNNYEKNENAPVNNDRGVFISGIIKGLAAYGQKVLLPTDPLFTQPEICVLPSR